MTREVRRAMDVTQAHRGTLDRRQQLGV